MRPNFTSLQLEWLRSHLPEYIQHVHRQTKNSSGRKYALTLAREFVQKWPPPLENQPHITDEDGICEKVHEWFKNNNKTPRNLPMLKTRTEPAQSAQQLFAKNDPNFKAALQAQLQGQPTSQNLPTFNRLKTEMWGQLTPEEQGQWNEQAAQLKDSKTNTATEEEKQSHRSRLEGSLTQVLRAYSTQTDFSFYVLAAGPSNVPGEPPQTFRMGLSSVEGLSFRDFHPTFQESIIQPWLDYADYMEEQRVVKERLHKLITTDPDGYPLLPAKGPNWSVREGSVILTAYLDQLWYKLHGSSSKHLQVPWLKLESDSGRFVDVNELPTSCQPFKQPSRFTDADSIIDLYKFCAVRIEAEPSKRFPFIIQPSPSECSPQPTPAQRKRQELVKLRLFEGCSSSPVISHADVPSSPLPSPVEPIGDSLSSMSEPSQLLNTDGSIDTDELSTETTPFPQPNSLPMVTVNITSSITEHIEQEREPSVTAVDNNTQEPEHSNAKAYKRQRPASLARTAANEHDRTKRRQPLGKKTGDRSLQNQPTAEVAAPRRSSRPKKALLPQMPAVANSAKVTDMQTTAGRVPVSKRFTWAPTT